MAREWTITVPAKIEAQLTGNYGNAQFMSRGVDWRIDVKAGPDGYIRPVIYRRNELRDFGACPRGIQRAANLALKTLTAYL